MNTTVVILAAGLGTRMRSKRAKVLHRAGGLALAEHVVAAATAVTAPENIVAVVGHQAEEVEALLAPRGIAFVKQAKQRGTGHAVAACRKKLQDREGLVMVLYGDTPLLRGATLVCLRDAQAASDAAATLITTTVDDPRGYGRVVVDGGGKVLAIVEQTSATPDQLANRVINPGIYCFRAGLLWQHIEEIKPDNPAHEYYLTDMAEILTRHGCRVRAMHVEDSSELLGINTRVELAAADRLLRARKVEALMLSGVTIERPETVTIDALVRVGCDTVIEPFSRLLGTTEIGEDCHIGAGAILDSAVLANRVTVAPYTLIANSRIESGAKIGPFARLRMNAEIGPDARIGNFVEVKKTRFGAGSKSQHLAYLGDSTIGDRVNVGAGTITCNFDGKQKHETRIGEGAFIGSNATLVAPVEIGEGSYIGAGSVITDAVPARALALGRGRQVVKPGWRPKKKSGVRSQNQPRA
jgi:bifunctional UDP-N-acetylglucosamine pyrophosphorylase / glucosamine-1-phosphate N-acetyltransferase